jgi:hypothetical protein
MKPKALCYVVLLTIFGLGIMAVLHFGQELAPPTPPTATVAAVATNAPQSRETSGWSGLVRNLNDPVSRLFLQLLVITVTARLVGRGFSLCGHPSVVGEMAAGILLGESPAKGNRPGEPLQSSFVL